MAVTIARRKLLAEVRAGQIIQDGTATTVDGVKRIANSSNWTIATRCSQLVSDWYAIPFSFAGAGVLPRGQSWGARWWVQVTPPWTEVEVRIRCWSDPGTTDSTITLVSSTDSQVITIPTAIAAWLPLDTPPLGVDSTIVEGIYLEISPGAGETVYVQGISISEIPRTSL